MTTRTPRYAARTQVSPERTRAEIEQTLRRFGADQFLHAWEPGRAYIGFRVRGYPVRMTLPLPDPGDFHRYRRANSHSWTTRTPEAARKAWEQAERQAWRALLLIIRAKLEAVQAGITTFEHEFLSDMLLPGDITIGQAVIPNLDESLSAGRLPSLLPGGGGAIPLPPAQDRGG